MFITIKQNNKKIKVDVSYESCGKYECFAPHKYQHRSYNETEGSMTNTDSHYSCSNRNYHGCPDKPVIKQLKEKQR